MIEFSGKIKDTIQLKIVNLRGRQAALLLTIIGLISIISGFILSITTNDKSGVRLFAIYGGLAIVLCAILWIPMSKRRLWIEWNYNIKIADGMITVATLHQNGIIKTKAISKVKKVIDYGEFYYLFVYRWDASYGIVCQKDLLIEGTIEEFEKLFEGKIKQKIK